MCYDEEVARYWPRRFFCERQELLRPKSSQQSQPSFDQKNRFLVRSSLTAEVHFSFLFLFLNTITSYTPYIIYFVSLFVVLSFFIPRPRALRITHQKKKFQFAQSLFWGVVCDYRAPGVNRLRNSVARAHPGQQKKNSATRTCLYTRKCFQEPDTGGRLRKPSKKKKVATPPHPVSYSRFSQKLQRSYFFSF